ncbi:MAG: lysophospholipid acyltransferase family protein [Zetaproteobacteria bacterium]|nr:lysophospholipid acyltransferase family protein [Zetaproteobacteria bacterium]
MIDSRMLLQQNFASILRFPRWMQAPIYTFLQWWLQEHRINHFIQSPSINDIHGIPFIEKVLDFLGVSYKIKHHELENIPAIGKLLVIANHPLGGLDALALIQLVAQQRQNKRVKILANELLMHIPQLHPLLIPIDTMHNKMSRSSYRAIDEALAREEAVIIFPAGEVSRLQGLVLRDRTWKQGFIHIATRNRAPILPIHIQARNSVLFYFIALFSMTAATLSLPRELFKKKGAPFEITIGKVINERWSSQRDISTKQTAQLFKKHLYRIGHGKREIFNTEQTIAHPESRQLLRDDLKQCQHLGITSDGKKIYLANYDQVPFLMREIGRLREYSFRKVDEGSGLKRDLDHYDTYYRHILLWDDQALEIVGAYRIGECQHILQNMSEHALYTATLCQYDVGFVEHILPQSIELGRSFVQPRYWGSRALDYLWQGIGAYLSAHPHIEYLFGPVSLSHSYPDAAKEALVYFYRHYFSPESASNQAMVAKTPYLISNQSMAQLKHIFLGDDYTQDLKALRDYLKLFNVSIPTLFKQYSELCEPGGVQFHDFGIDAEFNHCIDGYIVAQISKIKDSKRKRYIHSTPHESGHAPSPPPCKE